jgi:BarA-like signal transduction histidine kinase
MRRHLAAEGYGNVDAAEGKDYLLPNLPVLATVAANQLKQSAVFCLFFPEVHLVPSFTA